METAVAAAALLAEAMGREAAQTAEGAELVAKARQLVASGAHVEMRIAFGGDQIAAELGLRLDTGDLRVLGTKTMAKRPHGNC